MSTTIFLATILVLLAVLIGDALRFWLRQKEMQKHDRTLFPFCQLRRDVMYFMYMNVVENTGSLSPAEYKLIRRLLNVLDGTIRNYNQHNTPIFNVRKISKQLKMYRKVPRIALEVPGHPQIREFYERIYFLLVAAFLAYVPLIRWELALRLTVFVYLIGKQDGTRRREAEYVVNGAEKVRDDARHYNIISHYA